MSPTGTHKKPPGTKSRRGQKAAGDRAAGDRAAGDMALRPFQFACISLWEIESALSPRQLSLRQVLLAQSRGAAEEELYHREKAHRGHGTCSRIGCLQLHRGHGTLAFSVCWHLSRLQKCPVPGVRSALSPGCFLVLLVCGFTQWAACLIWSWGAFGGVFLGKSLANPLALPKCLGHQ